MSTPNFHTFEPGRNLVQGFPFKAHKITGFSPEMLEQHYEEVYGSAVRRLNEIELSIAANPGDTALRTEQLAVANAVVLHEVYFEAIGEEGGEELSDKTLQQALNAGFGGVVNWQSEFARLANSPEYGWTVLVWSDRLGRLFNISVTDHASPPDGAVPILALDIAEHAYEADFGMDGEAYIRAFLESIHWARVAQRFQRALGASIEPGEDASQISIAELTERLDKGEDVLVLDVRHDDDRERYTSRIMETEWRDSFDVAGWAGDLPKDKPVVVYCMYGFWVSQKAAQELRDEGIDARSLAGGITAWRAMGLPSTEIEI